VTVNLLLIGYVFTQRLTVHPVFTEHSIILNEKVLGAKERLDITW